MPAPSGPLGSGVQAPSAQAPATAAPDLTMNSRLVHCATRRLHRSVFP
jgi:hypothetical protein